MDLGLSTLLIFVIVFAFSFLCLRNRKGLPPGPVSIPLLGSVGFLWNTSRARLGPHHAFLNASKKYGSVISIRIGPKLLVVLNGYETIHKAFVMQAADFMDRPNWIRQIRNATKTAKGLSWSNGTEWKKMRKFSLQHLRSFGFGTGAMEDTIVDEIDKVSKILNDSKGNLIVIGHTFQYAVSNVICSLVFGQKFEYDDHIFVSLLRMLDLILKGQGFTSVANFIPEFMLPLFPKENALYQEKQKNSKRMRDFFDKLIQSHEETFDGENIRDFLDYYIKVKKGDNEGDQEDSLTKEPYFNKNNIYRVVFDLFLAGSETTATALQWCLLYFVEYPEVQTRCRQRIHEMVGDRQVKLSDRSKLPYIEATIQEILRLSNVTPLGVPRTNAERDIYINGYRIPKRTIILTNFYSAHVDSNYWENPLEFNPDRFLDEEEKLLKRDAFIPFSLGPRNCPGDSLAKMEMFLFVSILLQRFEFERDASAPPKDFSTDPQQVITLVPHEFKFKVIPKS